jgi:hypothetical protein
MKSNNNNDDDNDDDDDDNNNNMAMGSVHARGDTFLTFGLKALTETNTSRLATAVAKDTLCRWSLSWKKVCWYYVISGQPSVFCIAAKLSGTQHN